MLCVLTFSEATERQGRFGRLLNSFRQNRPVCVFSGIDDITIMTVKYIIKNNKINWKSIEKALGIYAQSVLCGMDIVFPDNAKITRFENNQLMHRICENAVLSFLSYANLPPKKTSIALYDLKGLYSNLAEMLVMYTSSLTVVTDEVDFYSAEASRIVYEKGAPLFVVKNRNALYNNQIIISPDKICEQITLPLHSVLFTGELPFYYTGGVVFDSFSFDIPQKYLDICPPSIEPEYFARALYSIKNVYSIAETIPNGMISGGIEYTNKDLLKYISSVIYY